jgi:hypothetical protein
VIFFFHFTFFFQEKQTKKGKATMNWMSDMLFNPAPSSARTERARRNSDSSTNLAAQAVGEEEVMCVCVFVFFII